MSTTVKQLIDVDEEAYELLHDLCQGAYLDGQCYEFAIALHEGLGWSIVGLMEGDTIRHAVLQPEGSENFFDARGRITAEQVGAPFGFAKKPAMKPVTPEDLRRQRPVPDHSVARARSVAEMLWPMLPWKEPLAAKLIAFADDLTALCLRHGIRLFSHTPTAAPILTELLADEMPRFQLAPTMDGAKYTLLAE